MIQYHTTKDLSTLAQQLSQLQEAGGRRTARAQGDHHQGGLGQASPVNPLSGPEGLVQH